ncbi:MAG: hypothetical protein JO026_03405 [Patescibacteria group bacterium]|nr:hypothetical protein [Patescibacteria group bacterium]
MPAAVTFFVSFFLLVAFILFRFWEAGRPRRILSRTRDVADIALLKAYRSAVTGGMPAEYRTEFLHFLHRLAHDTVVFLVEGLRSIEKLLLRLSYRMRHSAPQRKGKEPSEFLKTIGPGKKSESEDDASTI